MAIHKVIREDKVAVLYSPEYGSGWYTKHKIEELLYDSKVIAMVENKTDYKEIVSYCIEKYGKLNAYGGAFDLQIAWLPIGTEFTIEETDGFETIKMKDKINILST